MYKNTNTQGERKNDHRHCQIYCFCNSRQHSVRRDWTSESQKNAISGKIQSDAQYIVTLPSALKYVYMAMFLLGIALFFIFLAFKVSGNESVTMGHLYFALVFATIGFLVMLWASRWSIVVTGTSMEIYGLLHKKAELSMQDVGKVEIGKKDAMILYDTAGRKLITVDGLAENYDCLAKSLEENGKM